MRIKKEQRRLKNQLSKTVISWLNFMDCNGQLMKNVLPNDSSTFPWLLQFNWALWSFIAIVLYTLHAYSTGAFGTNKNYCVKQDEPTTGMDAGTRRLAWKCITAATQRGQAVVLTSHR